MIIINVKLSFSISITFVSNQLKTVLTTFEDGFGVLLDVIIPLTQRKESDCVSPKDPPYAKNSFPLLFSYKMFGL